MNKDDCNHHEQKNKGSLFYRLTHEEWVGTVKGLTGAEIKVLYYLRSLDPFGDRNLEYSITQIAKELDISKGATSKAVKKLDQLGLIDVDIVRVKIKIRTEQYKNAEFPIGNNVSYSESSFPIDNAGFQEETEVSYKKPKFPVGNTQPPECLSDNCFNNSQTIKTYSDFIQTLSESERERFFNFCQEKTKNLNQEVIDLEAWLASQTKAGKNRWEGQYRSYQTSTRQRTEQEWKNTQVRKQVEKWQSEIDKQKHNCKPSST